jgi:predicted deacylase
MNKLAIHSKLLALTGFLLLLFARTEAADEPPAGYAEDALQVPALLDPAQQAVPEIREDAAPAPGDTGAAAGSPDEEPAPANGDDADPVADDDEALAPAAAPGAAAEEPEPAESAEQNALAGQTSVANDEVTGEASSASAEGNVVPPTGLAIDTLSGESAESEPAVPLADAVTIAEETEAARTMRLLDGEVPPGTYRRLSWSATELFEGIPVSTPVLAVNGNLPGPTLCLTAAVHGDELNGIEMVRRVMHDLDPQKLSGAVIGVPIVNLQGFRRGSRYLPDRRDLNRYFPGNPNGSAASRIAHSFFAEVIRHCDALIDLHTGSFERANLPQLRADLRNPDVVTLTHGFGATVILHSDPAEGTLRYAASRIGIPTVTLEAGGPSELELKEVMHGVKGIDTLLNTLGMVKKARLWGDPEPVYYRSVWVRADRGGILLADVGLGSTVRRGDLLGTITDPMNNASTNLYAPFAGRIIGMARNQVVMPGFAAFHVGIQTAEASAADAGDGGDAALLHDSEVTNDDYIDGMSE